jgi:hypothetical protein
MVVWLEPLLDTRIMMVAAIANTNSRTTTDRPAARLVESLGGGAGQATGIHWG